MRILRPFRAIGRGTIRVVRSRTLPWTLLVLALGAGGYVGWLWQQGEMQERREREVLAVARDFLTTLTNFQADTIDQDVEEIRSFAVGTFADEVGDFFDQEAVDQIREAEAVSVGRIDSIFVQSLSGDSASVFGVVNEVVTNNTSPTASTEVVRLDVDMIETTAGWKVSDVEILQTPTSVPLGG
jgi:Mce-associated membrane protein